MIYIHKITGAERHINDYDIEKLGPDYHKKLSKFYDLKKDDPLPDKKGKDNLHKRRNIPSDKRTARADRTTGGAGSESTPKINTKEKSKNSKKKNYN